MSWFRKTKHKKLPPVPQEIIDAHREALAVKAEVAVPWQGRPASVQVDVPPLGVLWLAAERPSGA